MKKGIKRFLSAILAIGLLVTGCGKKIPEAPELLSPATENESYRPAELGDIGLYAMYSGVITGVITPTEYCHFWTTSVEVRDVLVNVGDDVKEGDVLAIANIDGAQKRIDDLRTQLSNMASGHETSEAIYRLTRQNLEYEKKAFDEAGDAVSATAKLAEIGILDENNRYDNMLYKHRVDDINKEIAAQQDIISDGTLKAKVSGKVVYSKELSTSRYVSFDENIVVIADYNDCYIEVTSVDALGLNGGISDFDVSKWSSFYTIVNGEKKYLEEYPYTKDEKLVAESKRTYPPSRLRYADGTKVTEIGQAIPIVAIRNGKEDVIRIGKDSLFEDSDGDYVYVKNGDAREKRYVQLGTQDRCYIEVISGLEEGEMVYYATEDIMPTQYEEYVAEISDYKATQNTKNYNIKDYSTHSYYSEYEGQLVTMNYTTGSQVNEGDLICVIKTDRGGAMLTELKRSIDSCKKQHSSAMEGYDEQLKGIDLSIDELENPPANTEPPVNDKPETATDGDADRATGSDADKENKKNPYELDMLKITRQIVEYQRKSEITNYEYQLSQLQEQYDDIARGNDGNGNISVYADTSGKISDIYISEGKNVTVGQEMFNIQTPASPCTSILSGSLRLGQKVTITTEKGDVYYGTAINIGGESTRCYLTTVNNKVYITRNSSAGNDGRSYIKMEDESFYKLGREKVQIEYVIRDIPDSIVIERDRLVYTEKDAQTNDVRSYVWKIVDGKPVKTYIAVANNDIGGETFCVIEGISEGDILVREITNKEAAEKASGKTSEEGSEEVSEAVTEDASGDASKETSEELEE
ncbi:MAG: efflux RND transporter periplasmic adaptor subunit [Lachnospiraceae bacterium]|nr:efflux RND transporter periplasmic adaptor subunit [Lachnospiraceae bacterium]